MSSTDSLIAKINDNIKLQLEHVQDIELAPYGEKWSFNIDERTKIYFNEDSTVNEKALENFRRGNFQIIPDLPHAGMNLVRGQSRGDLRYLRESLEMLIELGDDELLHMYPVPEDIGNPIIYQHKGYRYTFRWLRQIRMLSVFRKYLKGSLGERPICMDIGSGWGLFSYLIAQEIPQSTNVLVDFPEMLMLAHYFIKMSFPEARIATYVDLCHTDSIDRELLQGYDFVLLPHFMFDKIKANSTDVIINFQSFAEMPRTWFNFYVDSDVFKTTRSLLLLNRFVSSPEIEPTYGNDLNVLDYSLHDFDVRHFDVFPLFQYVYEGWNRFFYRKRFLSSQQFECVALRN
jgi:putative sugar O-methyltransferase